MQTEGSIHSGAAELVQRRKEQILAVARQIFARDGYRRTKTEQIALDLGVGKGTLYRYFDDKKALFLAVFEDGIAELRQTMRANVETIVDPPAKVAAAVRTYFEFFDNNRELIEIMMQVRSEFKNDYRRIFLKLYSDYIVKIQENLRAGIKMGLFREMDVEKTADAMSATLQGVLQGFYVREFGDETAAPDSDKGIMGDLTKSFAEESVVKQKGESLTDKIEAVTALLLEGLLKRPDESRLSEKGEDG